MYVVHSFILHSCLMFHIGVVVVDKKDLVLYSGDNAIESTVTCND